jgi:peptidoglycan/LPS O-acetylase OafA/YrhL
MIVEEIRAMTGVRGAAALFVMLYHFGHGLKGIDPASNMLNHGYLSVDLFFVLSGFVLSHVYGRSLKDGTFTCGEFLLHRIARIYPVYIVATMGVLAIEIWKAHGAPFGAAMIASNIFMLQSVGDWPSIDPPAWSVSAELIAYLIFPMLAILCLNRGNRCALFTGLVAISSIMALSILAAFHRIGSPIANGQLDLFYAPYTLIRCLAGFTIGQLIWRVHGQTWVFQLTSSNAVQIFVGLSLLCLIAFRGTDFFIYLFIIGLIC